MKICFRFAFENFKNLFVFLFFFKQHVLKMLLLLFPLTLDKTRLCVIFIECVCVRVYVCCSVLYLAKINGRWHLNLIQLNTVSCSTLFPTIPFSFITFNTIS